MPSLRSSALDVTAIDLDASRPALAALARSLSTEERERAARFRFPADRDRFLARRGLLRRLLGERLGVPPHALRYACNAHGKPLLAGDPAESDLRFSVSHSGALALFAFAQGLDVGVDVERVTVERADLAAAAACFSPIEVAELRALPSALRPRAFFDCWTRKEAFLKACGTGFQRPLDQFDVSLRPDEPARLRAVRWAPAEVSRWSLVGLEPASGFVAALAVRGRIPPSSLRKELSPCNA